MTKKLFVGNLSHEITNEELKEIFESHGTVLSANVIMDRQTNRSKGFGFVEMSSKEEAEEAIEALNEKEIHGRALTVNIARPRENRPNNFRNGNRERNFRNRY